MRKLIFLLLLIIFSINNTVGQNSGIDITVKSMDGRICQLENYINKRAGHSTLFVFWKTCCPLNLHMIDSLISLTDEYGMTEKLTVILVSVDDIRTSGKVMPIVRMKGWKADVILDVNMELARAMSVNIPPQWVAVNNEGKPFYRRKIIEGELDTEYYFNELLTEINKQ